MHADGPGSAFYGFLSRAVHTAVLDKALCEAPQAGSDTSVGVNAAIQQRFHQALAVLLGRAQQAGAVRADITEDGLRALVKGCLTTERHTRRAGRPAGWMVDVVRAGLRPSPAQD